MTFMGTVGDCLSVVAFRGPLNIFRMSGETLNWKRINYRIVLKFTEEAEGLRILISDMIFLMLFCRMAHLLSLWCAEDLMDLNTSFQITGRCKLVAAILLLT